MPSAEGQRPNWVVGTRIDGRFELTGVLSHTGSAVVWRCKDVVHGTMCTLVQHPRPRTADVESARKREAQLASFVSAECWVRVLGFGEWDGRTYLVAAEFQGESVEEVVRSAQACGQNIAPSFVVSIALEVLSALDLAAQAGIVHGDICTGSVFRGPGSVKTLCIGLARQHDAAPSTPLPHMAPEQIRNEAINQTTDLWGLGVLMYRMLFGNHPFLPSSSSTLRDAILQQPLQQHVLEGCHPGVSAVIARALERDPHRRFRNAQEMRHHLANVDLSSAPLGTSRSGTQQPDGTLSGSVWSSGPLSPRFSTPQRTPRVAGGDASVQHAVIAQLSRGSGPVLEYPTPASTPRGGGTQADMGIPLGTPRDSQMRSSLIPNRASAGGGAPPVLGHDRGPHDATPGSVGLVVTRDAPHRVMEVADMCDVKGIMQGEEGYSNPAVLPGDRLIAIDGVPIEMRPIGEVHALLRGPSGSQLELELARGRHAFKIVVMRHLPHRGGDLTPRGAARPLPRAPATPRQLSSSQMPRAQMHQHASLHAEAPAGRNPATPARDAFQAVPGAEGSALRGQASMPAPSPQQSVRPAAAPLDMGSAPALPDDKVRAGTSSVQPTGEIVQESGGLGVPAARRGGEAASSDPAKVLRVSQLGFDDGVRNFRSLATAIARCAPGGVVEISTGTYYEELLLHKSVHIQAESQARVTLSGQAGRALVACRADGVSLSGIIINQTGGDKSLRGRVAVRAVEVLSGTLAMTKCSVWSENGIGVMVADRGSAVLKQCVLQGNGKCGILATDGGTLTCDGCEVQANRMYGLVCESGSKVVASCNNFCNNQAVGVLVHRPGAQCTLVGNEISENGEMGIAVQDGAHVKMERNRAARNKHAGLYTDGAKAWASAWKTEFVESGVRGIGVQGGGCVEALECNISGNLQEGVFVSGKNSRGLLQGNDIAKNGTKGVGVQSSGFVLIKDNRIKANKEGGVFACDADTLTTVKDNVISHNAMRGIGIQLGATAEIEGNVIDANAAEGVYVSRPGSRALIIKNEILKNGVKGIGVQYGADASVEGNTIADNKLAGVHIDGQASRAKIRHNTITGHAVSIVSEQGSLVQSSSNSIQDLPGPPSAVGALSPRASAQEDPAVSDVAAHQTNSAQGSGQYSNHVYPTADQGNIGMQGVRAREAGAMHGGGRPDMLSAAQDVQARLEDRQVEEGQRQSTPRKDTGYQSVLTPRDASAGRVQVPVPSTPRGHVSRALGLPERSVLPARARASQDGDAGESGEGGVGESRRVHPLPATPDRPPSATPRALQVRASDGGGASAAAAGLASPAPSTTAMPLAEARSIVHAGRSGPPAPAEAGDHGAATPRGSSSASGGPGITPRGAAAVRGRLAAADMSPLSPGASPDGAGGRNGGGVEGGAAVRRAPPRPAVVPSLALDRVTPTVSENAHLGKTWRAEVEGLEGSRNRAFGLQHAQWSPQGGGFFSNVPRVQEEISTPRGGRRSDEGLLVRKGGEPAPESPAPIGQPLSSPLGAADPLPSARSTLQGLSPIGEEKEPRSSAPASSRLAPERVPLLRVDRQNQPRVLMPAAFGGGGVNAPNGSAPAVRPAGVPALKLGSVAGGGLQAPLSERIERRGAVLEADGGMSSARTQPDGSMKDWLMMPTYANTPRTTRSTLEQMPALDAGLLSPRDTRGSSAGDVLQANDREESPTVLPLHDEPDSSRAWPLSDWQDRVNGTTEWASSLLTPRR